MEIKQIPKQRKEGEKEEYKSQNDYKDNQANIYESGFISKWIHHTGE